VNILSSVRIVKQKIKELKARYQSKLTKIGTNTDFNPKEYNKKVIFCLFCIFLFWGVGFFMLIGDYMTIPQKNSIDDWNILDDIKNKYHNIAVNTNFWVIKIGDNKISNIEFYIIFLLMGFGFLRFLDLLILIERYKKF